MVSAKVQMPWWIAAPFDADNDALVAGWGFWFGLIGLAITICGFGLTWVQLAKAKSVAEAARDEAARIQLSLKRYDATQEAARAQSALEAAKRHFRKSEWEDGGERYDEFRRYLVSLKSSLPHSSGSLAADIDAASSYVSKLCVRIDRDIGRSTSTIDFAKTAAVMRNHDELMISIANAIEKDMF